MSMEIINAIPKQQYRGVTIKIATHEQINSIGEDQALRLTGSREAVAHDRERAAAFPIGRSEFIPRWRFNGAWVVQRTRKNLGW